MGPVAISPIVDQYLPEAFPIEVDQMIDGLTTDESNHAPQHANSSGGSEARSVADRRATNPCFQRETENLSSLSPRRKSLLFFDHSRHFRASKFLHWRGILCSARLEHQPNWREFPCTFPVKQGISSDRQRRVVRSRLRHPPALCPIEQARRHELRGRTCSGFANKVSDSSMSSKPMIRHLSCRLVVLLAVVALVWAPMAHSLAMRSASSTHTIPLLQHPAADAACHGAHEDGTNEATNRSHCGWMATAACCPGGVACGFAVDIAKGWIAWTLPSGQLWDVGNEFRGEFAILPATPPPRATA